MILSNSAEELAVRESVAHRIKHFGFMPRCLRCERKCKMAAGARAEIECIEYPGRLWAEYRDKYAGKYTSKFAGKHTDKGGTKETTKSEFVEAAHKAAAKFSAEGSIDKRTA